MEKQNIEKMKVIYNAVQSGWVVKKKKENLFEFKKNKKNYIKDLYLNKNNLLNFINNENNY